MQDNKRIVGVDIGGTYLRIGMVDGDLHLSSFQKLKADRVLNESSFSKSLADFLRSYIAEQNAAGLTVSAVSLGVPSVVDLKKRRVISSPNIPGFDNLPLADFLESRLAVPVYMDRDVNMIFRYDQLRLRLPKTGIGIGCYFGTGIGNAVSIDGRLLVGKDGMACELGHVPVMGRRGLCGCGNRGCSENYASGRSVRALQKRFYADLSIGEMFRLHGQDDRVQSLIDNMAVVVATEINIFNPHYLILGGGVILTKGFPREALTEKIMLHTRRPRKTAVLTGPAVYFSGNADQGGVIGAAICARFRMEGGIEHDCIG